jgi:tripartite-type tricarboxylate transporter receptor subunit TctC
MNFATCRPSCRRLAAVLVAGATLALSLPLPVLAAGYPDKPITLVVPFPAGGSVDAVVRAMQPRLAAALGQPLVIDNVGGAGGALGAAKVAVAANDGYTLLAGSINDMVLAPVLNKNVRYQPKDFVAIGPVVSSPPLLVARKDLPMNDLDAVVAALRAKPESLSYGSPGTGTMQHLLMEDLQSQAAVRMVHVPYKGAAPLVNDLLGGQVDLAVMVPSTALPHIEAGRLKVLGVASLQRQPSMKNIPTLNEGKTVSGLEANGWIGLFAPKGLAPDRIARLKAALEATLADRGVAEQLGKIGMQLPTAAERQGFAEQVGRDETKARSLGVKLQ